MRRAYFQLHLSIFLWGFTGIFGRAIDLKEVLLVWYRLLITVVLLLLINFFRKNVKRLSWKETLRISFVGFLVALHWVLYYGSIKYSNISVGLSCLATMAVFTSFLESLMTGRKINLLQLLLALLAAIGMYLIFTFQEFFRTGIILGIVAAFVRSLFTVLNSRLSNKYQSETLTAYEMGAGLLYLTLFLPFYIYFAHPTLLIPDAKNWTLLLAFSVLCTVIPFDLSIKAFKHLSAYTSSLSVNLVPIYGIALAFFFYHEQKELTPGFYAGTSIILLSVVLYMMLNHRHQIRQFAMLQREKFKSENRG